VKFSKKVIVILAILVVGFCVGPALAQEDTTATPAPAGATSWVWTFMNSPVGMSVVGFLLLFLLGKLFTAKPQWKVYVDKYRPMLISAVKQAEKLIPDDVPNPGLARLDAALKYMIRLNNTLDTASLTQAITAVHSELEGSGVV